MMYPFNRAMLWVVLVFAVGLAVPQSQAAQVDQGSSQALDVEIASVEQLTTEAFSALRAGRFDRTHELMTRAAAQSEDPGLTQMARWIGQFETQRQIFLTERRKQHEKAVADAHLLLDNDMSDFAVSQAARAFVLAEDKDRFRNEPWVAELVQQTIDAANQHEENEQWLKALRLYSNLGEIEPSNPLWKDKLKLMTRRVRMLALYTPDGLKSIRKADTKAAEAAERLLKPDEEPKKRPELELNEDQDAFRLDWREQLRGIRLTMLQEAIVDARTNYYRDIRYRELMIGGIKGLQTLATTRGLESSFPQLADDARREAFIRGLEVELAKVNRVAEENEQRMVRTLLMQLQELNGRTIGIPEEVWVSEFADGAFGELDPFTSMIWPNDLEEFARSTQGEFSGVGIQIQSDEDGSLRVVSPLEDTPAFRAGIKAGDIITHIDGRNAKGITLNQAVRSITGPVGTNVTLMIRSPDGESSEFTITRETIKVASVKGWRYRNGGGGWDYLIDNDQKIGYVRMTNFTRTTVQDLDRAVQDMKRAGARAMILDLRYNPGGLLTSATEVADRFLTHGDIVSTKAARERAPNQETRALANRSHDEIDLPTIVLVNQYSASASEIVSGALKDQKRAMVVGERTFGKGSVQMLFPLARIAGQPTAYLKLTTSHYYLPSGRNIHRKETSTEWGVDPDIIIEMTPEQMRAAIDARQDLDILRDIEAPPAESEQQKLDDIATAVEEAVDEATAEKSADPLESDPQLSAALLLLRLQLAGAEL
jgi:carboxyl-terminal processing protease